MIESSCHCGAVKLEVELAPAQVTECNCSICRRYGALWAYYSPAQVRVIANDMATDRYLWGSKSIDFHRCRHCGCVTHWAAAAPPAARMGVNARLMAPEILAAARRRRLDGADTWKILDE